MSVTVVGYDGRPLPAAASTAELGSGIGEALDGTAGDGVASRGVGVELGVAVTGAVGVGEASAALLHETSVMLMRPTISFFTRTIMPLSSIRAIRAMRANAYARRRT